MRSLKFWMTHLNSVRPSSCKYVRPTISFSVFSGSIFVHAAILKAA
jgi:hypothetical protein